MFGINKEVRQPIFDCDFEQILKSDRMVSAGIDFLELMKKRGALLLDTEMVLGDNELKYVGQPDKMWLIENKEKNTIGIFCTDYKTNKPKNFESNHFTKPMKHPFGNLPNNALGHYYLKGITNSAVKANPERAREMFSYSATYFGDRDAQYYLGKLYLDGIGGNKDVKQAVRWLNLSSEKGHRLSQATLGELLASGKVGSKQRARAIMWLTLASDGADPEKDAWILDLNKKVISEATENDRIAAKAYLDRWSSRKTATMAGSGVTP